MSELSKKYTNLARAALKVIELDNAIIAALENGDISMMQAYLTSRVLPVQTVNRLAAWEPPTD